MKKTLSIIAGIFALLAVSCMQENLENPAAGKEVTVTFCAAVPTGIATKADAYDYSDGTSAKTLHYGVYVTGETTPRFQSKVQFNEDLQAVVNLTLATGLSYDFIFWAQSDNATSYSVDWETRQMTVDYTTIKANDENNDAFYAYVPALKVKGAVTERVELFRPFAQINLGTNDYKTASDAGLEVDRTNMVVAELPNILNFVDGTVEGKEKATFAVNAFDRTEEYPVKGYEYLEMNYILAGTQKTTAELFTFNVWEPESTGKVLPLNPNIQVVNVPYQRNYQTNIYGSLLTDPTNFTVVIRPAYTTEPDHDVPADAAAIYAAAKNGGKVSLESDIVLSEVLNVENDLTINLNGHKLEYKADVASDAYDKYALVNVTDGKTLTVEGKGEIKSFLYIFNVVDGTLNLAGDIDYTANLSVAQVSKGTLNITAGNFQLDETTEEYAAYNTTYLLNCLDSAHANGEAVINVKGGSYKNFNPADNAAEGANTNFVAEGYESVKRDDADIYDVKIKAGNATVTITTAAELKTMLTTLTDSGSGNNTIIIDANIELAEGEVWEPVVIQGYTGAGLITIEGKGHHISGLSAPLFLSGFAGNSAIDVKDLTIKNSVMSSASDYAGAFFGQCDAMQGLTFTNCHVENVSISGPDYVAGFVGWTSGWDGAGAVETNISLTGCTVKNCNITSTGDGSIGAFIGHSGANANNVTTISNCSVTGCTFAQGTLKTNKIGYAIGTVNLAKETTLTKVTGDANYYMKDGVKTVLEVKIGRVTGNSASKVVVDDKTYIGEQVNIL